MAEIVRIRIPARGLATGTPIVMEAAGYKGPVCAQALAKFKLGQIVKTEQTAEFLETPMGAEQQVFQEGY